MKGSRGASKVMRQLPCSNIIAYCARIIHTLRHIIAIDYVAIMAIDYVAMTIIGLCIAICATTYHTLLTHRTHAAYTRYTGRYAVYTR